MENTLNKLFKFLNSNRIYNHSLQERFYNSVVSPFETPKDKLISILYNIANTQSQPKIDKLANFFKSIISKDDGFETFSSFICEINPEQKENTPYENLFNGMQRQNGWGNKTAALFTKTIYHLHNGQYSDKLEIWHDVPEFDENHDQFFLPVDSVIIRIFRELDNSINWNFSNINLKLKKQFTEKEIEVWDDLWFWGYFSQKVNGNERILEWNENKYWTLKESDKKQATINQIKRHSEEFLKIIMNHN
jgi:hypothetical protein